MSLDTQPVVRRRRRQAHRAARPERPGQPGAGDYYGGFDAQTVFDTEVPEGALLIEIFRADNTAYSKRLNKVRGTLSGTKVREMLSRGEAPPPEFSRPEVATILMIVGS